MSNRGFVYVATGKNCNDEARESIRWLRAHGNCYPIAIFSDAAADDFEVEHFYQVSASANGFHDKIKYMAQTPFQETVFLDSDTFVVDDITELFGLLEVYDLAAAHAPGGRGIPDGAPLCFFELNTGVIAFKWSPRMSAFFDSWLSDFSAGMNDPANPLFSHDQPMFRRHVWAGALALYVLPPEYNYRSIFSGFVRDRVKIFHGRHDDINAVIQTVNGVQGLRVFGGFS